MTRSRILPDRRCGAPKILSAGTSYSASHLSSAEIKSTLAGRFNNRDFFAPAATTSKDQPAPPSTTLITLQPPSKALVTAQTARELLKARLKGDFEGKAPAPVLPPTPIVEFRPPVVLPAATGIPESVKSKKIIQKVVEQSCKLEVERFKPKSLAEFHGQEKALQIAKSWLSDRMKGRGGKDPLILLLKGPPGVGKTTLANLLLDSAGFRIREINASDMRVGEQLAEAIKLTVCAKAMDVDFMSKRVGLILDEIDGIMTKNPEFEKKRKYDDLDSSTEDDTPQKTGIDALIHCIKKLPRTCSPIIATCNELPSKKLRHFSDECCLTVSMYRLKPKQLKDLALRINSSMFSRNEAAGIISPDHAWHLAVQANGDARSLINRLQMGLLNQSEDSKDLCISLFDGIRELWRHKLLKPRLDRHMPPPRTAWLSTSPDLFLTNAAAFWESVSKHRAIPRPLPKVTWPSRVADVIGADQLPFRAMIGHSLRLVEVNDDIENQIWLVNLALIHIHANEIHRNYDLVTHDLLKIPPLPHLRVNWADDLAVDALIMAHKSVINSFGEDHGCVAAFLKVPHITADMRTHILGERRRLAALLSNNGMSSLSSCVTDSIAFADRMRSNAELGNEVIARGLFVFQNANGEEDLLQTARHAPMPPAGSPWKVAWSDLHSSDHTIFVEKQSLNIFSREMRWPRIPGEDYTFPMIGYPKILTPIDSTRKFRFQPNMGWLKLNPDESGLFVKLLPTLSVESQMSYGLNVDHIHEFTELFGKFHSE